MADQRTDVAAAIIEITAEEAGVEAAAREPRPGARWGATLRAAGQRPACPAPLSMFLHHLDAACTT